MVVNLHISFSPLYIPVNQSHTTSLHNYCNKYIVYSVCCVGSVEIQIEIL